MINPLPRTAIVATLAIISALLTSSVSAQDTPTPYDCAKLSVSGNSYDISALKKSYLVKGEPKTEHPYKVRYDYSVNPCQAITVPDGESKLHCLPGTWVCRDKKVFFDESDPKTVSLQPIAGTAPAAENVPAREVAPLIALADKIENVAEVPWNLTLKGGLIDGQDQSAVITFICDTAATDDNVAPTLTGSQNGVTTFQWKSKSACAVQSKLPVQESMSGFSVFLTVFFSFAFIYLVLGAVYNHQVYGAKGFDLIPHKDFWRDFPSLVVDVVHHVWDSVTGRARGGGYVSV
ncbi:hypothetical protein BGZ97_011844 [Linnemannia gamsii]|uniref:Autophagy-related protein 27 n=1 Tax=Linnemannia gamsii TaxID=64522 RepID=A0A9P6R731_9FUNG|nr:hypothetical protein BGZ97_011844 [Linnemannia gamsii]